MNVTIFQIFPNLSQNWFKFKKILEKSGDFAQNLAKKLGQLVYKWVTFSWKIGVCMDLLSNYGGTSQPIPNLSTSTPPPPPPPGAWTP